MSQPLRAPALRWAPHSARLCARVAALWLLLLCCAGPVRAEPSGDADRERAVQLFAHASALEAASRWPEAISLLERAIELKETPGLRYHLAFCLEQQGRLTTALLEYERAAKLLDTQPAPDVAELVGPARAALVSRIPLLRLEMSEEIAAAKVTVDTRPAELAQPLRLDPGTHDVRVEAPGRAPFHTQLVLVEGDRRTLSIALAREARRPQRPRVVPQRRRPRRAVRDGVVVTEAVLTTAALTLGLVFTARRSAAYQRAREADERIAESAGDADAYCVPSGSLAEPCADLERARRDIDVAKSAQLATLVGAGVGALSTVTTVLLWKPRRPAEPVRSIQMNRLELRSTPGGGLGVTFGATF